MTVKLSKQLTRFRKNHSIQHCLVSMLETLEKVLHQGRYICGFFMDLSKAFDTLSHDLWITKLGAYGFETDTWKYMQSYLMNKKQRVRVKMNGNQKVRVNKNFRIATGVLLRLNSRSCNCLTSFWMNFSLSFQTPWVTILITIQFTLLEIIWKWFRVITRQFWCNKTLVLRKTHEAECRKKLFHVSWEQLCKKFIQNYLIENSNEQKTLGLIRDGKLIFKRHRNEICKKVLREQKLYVDCQAII